MRVVDVRVVDARVVDMGMDAGMMGFVVEVGQGDFIRGKEVGR